MYSAKDYLEALTCFFMIGTVILQIIKLLISKR